MARMRVTSDYQAQYDDPISFESGEPIDVGAADAEFAGWYWCRNRRGKEGWVHRQFLSATEGSASAVRDYSARELTLKTDAEAEVLQQLDGWLLARLDDGSVGWLPATHAQILPD